jgi:hypothetical protein
MRQGSHGHRPSVAAPANDVGEWRAGTVEDGLEVVSLAGHLAHRTKLDAALVQRHDHT